MGPTPTLARRLASLELTVVLLLLLAAVVVGGTLVQAEAGLYEAQRGVFGSWFFLLFGVVPMPGMLAVALLLFVNLGAAAVFRLRYRWRHAGLLLVHYGLLLLIAGGFFIALTTEEYFLTLREGESGNSLSMTGGGMGPTLPFSLRLLAFEKAVHPGTEIPKSFTSRVEITENSVRRRAAIAMNRPLRLRGYTFYQSAYSEGDASGRSSTLSVVRGPGRRLPYAASALIFLGLAWHFLAMISAALKKRRRAAAGSGS